MGRRHYIIEDGQVREFTDAEYAAWSQDPLREGHTFYSGLEGLAIAERVVGSTSEVEAMQALAHEQLLAAGLTEQEYEIWRRGARSLQEEDALADAMQKIR